MLKQLAGQTAIYGVGTIVPRFLNYLLFPYLTRLMTTGEYGVVTDLYALIPFALVVLTMGLETGYFRFAGQAATERERKEVFETTWGAVSLFALLFFAAALLFTPALARIMDYAEHPSYIRLTAAMRERYRRHVAEDREAAARDCEAKRILARLGTLAKY